MAILRFSLLPPANPAPGPIGYIEPILAGTAAIIEGEFVAATEDPAIWLDGSILGVDVLSSKITVGDLTGGEAGPIISDMDGDGIALFASPTELTLRTMTATAIGAQIGDPITVTVNAGDTVEIVGSSVNDTVTAILNGEIVGTFPDVVFPDDAMGGVISDGGTVEDMTVRDLVRGRITKQKITLREISFGKITMRWLS